MPRDIEIVIFNIEWIGEFPFPHVQRRQLVRLRIEIPQMKMLTMMAIWETSFQTAMIYPKPQSPLFALTLIRITNKIMFGKHIGRANK